LNCHPKLKAYLKKITFDRIINKRFNISADMSSCAYPKKIKGKIQMDKKEEISNAILECISKGQSSNDKKKLPCIKAFELAKKYDLKIIEIGRICNEHSIKICKCQLGCFE
jgi:hypothetical protein